VKLSTPGAYQPDRLLDKVGSTLAAPESLVTGLHVFTFNQVQQAEQWRQALLSQLSARASR
jgi:methylenetetrahydrofolate reductase (NADPH)